MIPKLITVFLFTTLVLLCCLLVFFLHANREVNKVIQCNEYITDVYIDDFRQTQALVVVFNTDALENKFGTSSILLSEKHLSDETSEIAVHVIGKYATIQQLEAKVFPSSYLVIPSYYFQTKYTNIVSGLTKENILTIKRIDDTISIEKMNL